MVRYTRDKRCIFCDKDISERGNRSFACEDCMKWYYKEYFREYYQCHHKKYELGTTDFSEHRKDDYVVEHREILDEMVRLGLRKRHRETS